MFFTAPVRKQPTGGITNYFLLSHLLTQMGVESFVVSDRGFDPWWIEDGVSCDWLYFMDVDFKETDIVISHEEWKSVLPIVRPARIVPYMQSTVYVRDLPVGFILALSYHIQRYLKRPSFVVERVLREYWRDDGLPKSGVLVVPMKNGTIIEPKITPVLRANGHKVTVVDEPVHASVLRELYREHRYYIPLSFPEGLGMLAQEAMACGCMVVGFDGGGRSDYMWHKQTAWVSPDGDWESIVRAIDYLEDHPEQRLKMTSRASRVIERYRPNSVAVQLRAALVKMSDAFFGGNSYSLRQTDGGL